MGGHLGIDPGLHGAWALLDKRGLLLVAGDFPIGKDGEIDVVALADTWRDLEPEAATVELVGHISAVNGRKMGVTAASISAAATVPCWPSSTCSRSRATTSTRSSGRSAPASPP